MASEIEDALKNVSDGRFSALPFLSLIGVRERKRPIVIVSDKVFQGNTQLAGASVFREKKKYPIGT